MPASRVNGTPVRVLVVDDHPVVRFGLSGMINAQPDLEVVGEAASCRDGCKAVEELLPDVVLLDLELEDARGVEALIRLRDRHPDLPVVVYTAFDNDWRVLEAVREGVQGYLKKDAPSEHVFEAIRVASRGGSFLDPAVAAMVMGEVGGGRQSKQARLSVRERTVLKLLAEGKRNKEISALLFISERTVKFHVSTMLSKLNASNRTEAVKNAARMGLINL